jgi:hypothetical protein
MAAPHSVNEASSLSRRPLPFWHRSRFLKRILLRPENLLQNIYFLRWILLKMMILPLALLLKY